ncbi:MAG TPA: hypothetical protein VNR38_10470 [Ureibacillus sp.]|nr:hypothetical protein [Ureibacillus sp.]
MDNWNQMLFTLVQQNPIETAILLFTICLLIVVWVRLNKIVKIDLVKDKRDATEKAITYADRFTETIIPHLRKYKANVFDLAYYDNTFVSDVKGIYHFKYDYPLTRDQVATREEFSIHEALYHLKTIATGIQHGKVDKEVCRKLFGQEFCEAVEVYYDMILHVRKEDSKAYDQVISLYQDWRKKFTKIKPSKSMEFVPERRMSENPLSI